MAKQAVQARQIAAWDQTATTPAAKLLLETPEEVALHIAGQLDNPKDLLRLGMACRRYRLKIVTDPDYSGSAAAGADAVGAAPEMWSIVSEAARRWLGACSEQERGWVQTAAEYLRGHDAAKGQKPRRGCGSWLGPMAEVQKLRLPLKFGRAPTNITLTDDLAVATQTARPAVVQGSFTTLTSWAAASTVRMRAGRHFAQFTALTDGRMYFGVIVSSRDAITTNAHREDGHCFFDTINGCYRPGYCAWLGQPAISPDGWLEGAARGDRIGMLLDLDQGSLTVFKNDERLGVMEPETLCGWTWVTPRQYSWSVCLSGVNQSVRIDSGPVPASPTELELEAAREYQEAYSDPVFEDFMHGGVEEW